MQSGVRDATPANTPAPPRLGKVQGLTSERRQQCHRTSRLLRFANRQIIIRNSFLLQPEIRLLLIHPSPSSAFPSLPCHGKKNH